MHNKRHACSLSVKIAQQFIKVETDNYPRDMCGYGRCVPKVAWPGKARIAVQFVVNYEEGSENCVLHGDTESEAFLSEITGAAPFVGERHMNMESIYEFGSRAGFWRLWREFTNRKLPVTVFGVAMALQRNPEAVSAMLEANWEIASHGYRWIDYAKIDVATERAHHATALRVHEKCTGSKPQGWYIGRTSANTRDLLLELGDWTYDSDTYADDLPYWVQGPKGPHLLVPYTLDANDMRFCINAGYTTGEQFFTYLRDAFDCLYAEGKDTPKMMSVGLHCRLIGRPGRFVALQRFLDHVAKHDKAWVCTRLDIAKHWHEHHKPKP